MSWEKIKHGFLFLLGVLILFWFFAGIITAIGALVELHSIKSTKTWQPRRGLITVAYVSSYRAMRGRPSGWQIQMAGRYLDGEGTFGVARIAYGFGNEGWGRRGKEAVVNRYPKGTELTVYVDPDRPNWVVLDPNPSPRQTYIGLKIALAGILLPFLLYLWGRLRGGSSGVLGGGGTEKPPLGGQQALYALSMVLRRLGDLRAGQKSGQKNS